MSQFEARIPKSTLSDVLSIATAVGDEAVFHVDDGELRTNLIDPANVAMATASVTANGFEELSADGLALGMNLNKISEAVGMAKSGESVELRYDEETRKLTIDLGDLEYTMALIDPDTIRPGQDSPDLDFHAEVTVATSELKRGQTAAEMVSDSCDVGVNEDGEFFVSAEGDTDDVDYDTEETEVVPLKDDGVCSSTISLGYFKEVVKSIPSDEVTIYVGESLPTVFEFEFAPIDEDEEECAGEGSFAIAPRIES